MFRSNIAKTRKSLIRNDWTIGSENEKTNTLLQYTMSTLKRRKIPNKQTLLSTWNKMWVIRKNNKIHHSWFVLTKMRKSMKGIIIILFINNNWISSINKSKSTKVKGIKRMIQRTIIRPSNRRILTNTKFNKGLWVTELHIHIQFHTSNKKYSPHSLIELTRIPIMLNKQTIILLGQFQIMPSFSEYATYTYSYQKLRGNSNKMVIRSLLQYVSENEFKSPSFWHFQ